MKKETMVLEGVEFIVEVNDGGEKTVSVNGVDINLNFNGVRLATIEDKVNLGKIYNFVDKHKYDDETINTDKNGVSKNIGLRLGGFDFHGHWEEESNKDTNRFNLNDFMPDYSKIIDGLSDLEDSISSQFLSPKYYEDEYKEFIQNLKDLDITTLDNCGDEYDVLMTFSLPSSKLDDETYIEQFVALFTDYKNKFNDELDVLYGNY